MSNNLPHRNCNIENPKKNRILIKTPCYLVTLTITKFLWAELNRVIQEELVDTKFDDFEEGLALLFYKV